jgi:tetratricopeptide (TPR) repeat protein
MQLFDLVGAESNQDESEEEKVGKDQQESAELGRLSMVAGQYEKAIGHFKKAAEQGRVGFDNLMDLAGAYESADLLPQAFHQYEKAKKIHASGELLLALGNLYRRYGRLKDTVHAFEEAVRLEPENAYLHFRLAEILRQQGFRSASLQAIQGAISTKPEDPFYHYWEGDLLIEMKKFGEAVGALQAAIELSPGDDHLLFLLSVALWGDEKRPEAIRAIRLAGDLNSDKLGHVYALGVYLKADGHEAEAQVELRKAEKIEAYDLHGVERLFRLISLSPPLENE